MAKKGQAAMEYLMTYGWAVAIVAVSLAALFTLGVFRSTAVLGTTCFTNPGYLCTSPLLFPNGNVSFTFGQDTGATFFNVGLSCVVTTQAGGLPFPSNSIVELSASPSVGATTNQPASSLANSLAYNSLTISNGESVIVSGLKCFDINGNPITSLPLGGGLNGQLWVNFTTGTPTTTGTWITMKAANIDLQVK